MRNKRHRVEFCVVGGGLAGLAAAVSAARRGVKTVLMHDRPVLGGNASSEVRMWICGAHGENNRETGIVEELELENLYRNPTCNYSIWDSILYEKARFQANLTLLLNCSCNDAVMDDRTLQAVKGWQLTTETWHTVEADLFADCSGDSILIPLTQAAYRLGREAREEFAESIEPEQADARVMSSSCLIQARETDRPQPFIPPDWAYTYQQDDPLLHPHRDHVIDRSNFWWIEVGGEQDTIHDTEELRDELLRIAFGVWDHIKNQGDHGAENWMLEWVGFLPGKRESRRYVGDYILTENDIRAEARCADLVAYGGWTMDDHYPKGFYHQGKPTIHHPAPSPFGIPYRCLYSRNVTNLFCAGRNISTTHAALSSTRVMATCAAVGQAVGTAAALAIPSGLSPRDVYEQKIDALQQALMEDDCYLPWHQRRLSDLTSTAVLAAEHGNPGPLRSGVDRPVDAVENAWDGPLGSWLEYRFSEPEQVKAVRLVFDSDLNRKPKNMPCNYPLDVEHRSPPGSLVRRFRIEAVDSAGEWQPILRIENNYQRLVSCPVDVKTTALRLIPEATWGAKQARIFAWDLA